ncbi:MAG TPA: iron-sulfur cluster insertion protein ErpA [Anaerolineales bacterium]|nr:iron-sulfur cluster insertion protein ErpA [Anaerolineales bacterium]HRF48420.1 iron-sulfur cluster insertion protein ErpA [Anaerolineales bacterium]
MTTQTDLPTTLPDLSVTPEPVLTLLPAAATKLTELLASRNLTDHGLRVFVSGGGCSGMQYGMAIEKEASEFDTVFEQNGIRVIVDPTSLGYLTGATIDYIDNLMGGGFRIDNPNAVSTCGCGHSFRSSGQAEASDEGESCGSGCGCH